MAENDLPIANLAWAAGIIDGEGCISIYGKANRITKKGVRALQLILQVVNIDPRMLQELRRLFGGTVGRCSGRLRSNCRPCFFWVVTGSSAGKILEMVRPFLIIKSEQADIGLAYAATIKTNGPLPDSTRSERANLQVMLRSLKESA